MADGTFNISKAKAHQLVIDFPNELEVILLKANEAETALVDHNDMAALLAAAGNTEADFTNYARKTGLAETVQVDDTNDLVDIDVPDQTWTAAGGTTNNTLTKAIVAVQTGGATPSDSALIPLTHHDFAVTTDGSDLTIQFDAQGFYRSQ